MEICAKVKATYEELRKYFDFDEVLDIRFYEKIEAKNLYKIIIRIPECNIKDINSPITLHSLKQKIVKKCRDTFRIHSMVIFADGTSKTIYASTPYWETEYAKKYAEYLHTKVVRIERIAGGNVMEN